MLKINCHEDIINYCEENNITIEMFNEPVEIDMSNVCFDDLDCLFSGCTLFNQPVTIPEGVTSCANMFYDCVSFNQPIIIPEGVINCEYMFNNCVSFNKPVVIPNSVVHTDNMFEGCIIFNQPIVLPKELLTADEMFLGCYNFNSPVSFENIKYNIHCSMLSLNSMFKDCYKFNQPVDIHYADVCSNMFENCYNLNSKITFSEYPKNTPKQGELILERFLKDCYLFNQKIEFPESYIRRANYLFENCYSFNQEVEFGYAIKDLSYAFCNCVNFNSKVTLPEYKRDIKTKGLFWKCINFNAPIITNCVPNLDVSGMFNGCKNLTTLTLNIEELIEQYDINSIFRECVKLKIDKPLDTFNRVNKYGINCKYEHYKYAFANTNIDIVCEIGNELKTITELAKFFSFISKYTFDEFKEKVKVKINDTDVTVSLKSFISTRFKNKDIYTYMYNDSTDTITVLYNDEYTRRNPIPDNIIAKMLLDSTLKY